MDTEVLKLSLSKQELSSMEKGERTALLSSAFLLEEIGILNRSLLFANQTNSSAASHPFKSSQELFHFRTLVSKLVEVLRFFEKTKQKISADSALKELFVNHADKLQCFSGNLKFFKASKKIRDKYVSHYDGGHYQKAAQDSDQCLEIHLLAYQGFCSTSVGAENLFKSVNVNIAEFGPFLDWAMEFSIAAIAALLEVLEYFVKKLTFKKTWSNVHRDEFEDISSAQLPLLVCK